MNIREIARLAAVTPGTVSKVLNNYSDISEATKQHVLKIIEENQYDPKANARSSKSGRDNPRIGMVTESVYNGLYGVMEHIMSINIHNAGYSLVTIHDNYYVQDKQEKFCELKANIERDKLGGLIYIGGNFEKVSGEEFDDLPCPAIFVNTVLPFHAENTGYSSVQVSHYDTACKQMQYLIKKGHRDICTVISSVQDNSVYGLRAKGYRVILGEHRLEHNLSNFLEGDYECKKAYKVLLNHLRLHPEITAVCCEADIMVPGILRAIQDAGKAPGKDVEIISFDGLEYLQYSLPSVTTFAQPTNEMASYINNLMFGLISKEREHQHITFQPKFIKRESC